MKTQPEEIVDREAGQAFVSLTLMLCAFLLAVMAFAVDLSNMWFHRQSTQTAADAACQAGALDMLAVASGANPPSMGFVTGTASSCTSSSAASICKYAGFNGYPGAGLTAGTASNAVTWTFPSSVPGVTPPSSASAPTPFLKVVVAENVKTTFMALLGIRTQQVASACTCGITSVLSAAPMLVLNPSNSGTLAYSGGAVIKIIGGPQRSIQVNSTSSTAVACSPSGVVDTSTGGPKETGGDLAIGGGPTIAPSGCYSGGSTGTWQGPTLPIADPYSGVAAPTQPATASTSSTPHIVTYGQDGCPDHSPTNYVSTTPHSGCIEYEPGYYPSGISQSANDVIILKPGVYYMNGSFSLGGSDEVRLATPCVPSCSPYSSSTGPTTDGVMFYFASGSLQISGGSGAMSSSRVDSVHSTALTCNGSAPPAYIGAPSTIDGNVLLAQCTTSGTYVGVPSTDTVSTTGSRGLLVFMSHSNPVSSTTLSGSGALIFAGTLYFHSSGYASTFSANGGSGSTAYAIGEIVADNISLTGSGAIMMALSATPSVPLLKVSILQ